MRERTTVQSVAMLVGIVFLLTGILGFIPGITTNYDDLAFAGPDSGAKLLGIFQVSILHNLVHALFGIVGLVLARTVSGARTYLIGGGVIYLVLFVYGLVVSSGSDANFIPFNGADDVLHLLLGIGMIALGYVAGRETVAARPAV
jgi:ABC-type transport system involved in multi-copper enzyme maturation permease subunit